MSNPTLREMQITNVALLCLSAADHNLAISRGGRLRT
jgi:hypothetical protein